MSAVRCNSYEYATTSAPSISRNITSVLPAHYSVHGPIIFYSVYVIRHSAFAHPMYDFCIPRPDMNGHVFGCYDKQPNKRQYALTMAALRQFACKSYKFANDFECIFHTTPREPVVPRPTMPNTPVLTRTTRAAAAAAADNNDAPAIPGLDPIDKLSNI